MVDAKFAEMAAEQRQAMDWMRDDILGAVEDKDQLITSLALQNENVVVYTDDSWYLLFIY